MMEVPKLRTLGERNARPKRDALTAVLAADPVCDQRLWASLYLVGGRARNTNKLLHVTSSRTVG